MSTAWLDRILGPRVSREELSSHRGRYALPTLLFLVAAILLVVSILTPYWRMTLHAPQYPKGLHVQAYVNRMTGDVAEIDGLNHYIGMRRLDEAAQVERAIAIQAIGVVACLMLAAIIVHSRWAALLAFPGLVFPAGFLGDLQFWLWNFGQNLDPKAPLSSSVKPFIPPVLGVGRVGQFHTVAGPDTGLFLAFLASACVLVGLWAHRRAYKPLVERAHDASRAAPKAPGRGAAAWVLLAAASAVPLSAQAADLGTRIAEALPGDTVFVEAGVHAAPVTIDKPLTLEGSPGAVIQGNGSGDLVRITSPDVAVRGLLIRGTGASLDAENAAVLVLAPRVTIENNVLEDDLFGLYLRDASDCVLRGNRIVGKPIDIARRGDAIRLWSSDRCVIEDNEVIGTRDVIVWYSKDVLIRRNRIRDSRYGLHFMYANQNVVEENRLEDNSVGAFLMYSKDLVFVRNLLLGNRGPSGYGLGMKDVDGVVAEGNEMLGNRVGLYLDNSPFAPETIHVVRGNVFAFNDVGVAFQPAVQRNRFIENTFRENLEQVAVVGSGELRGNEFSSGGRGNFWSDYKGFDLDGDGIGDVPHRSESLFENIVDREAKLRLFLFSPAQQAIELAAAAVPTFKPRPKLVDDAPLMSAPEIVSLASVPPAPWPLGAFAGLLVAGSLATLGTVRRSAVESIRRVKRAASATSAVAASAPVVRVEDAAAASPAPLLRVEELTKRFGSFVAVDRLSWDVRPGEAVALWGKNGAGKTTAIKCVLGLHLGTGRIFVDGHDASREGKRVRAAIGYVPQELALPADMGTREALAFYARLKKVEPARVEKALRDVEMLDHDSKRIGELSGGMKQRIALAVALLADPPLLVLDEMTSNLDAAARAGFMELLVRQKERGKTILFTTHRPDEVQALADRVLLLERGKLVRSCPRGEFAEAIGLRAHLRVRVADADVEGAIARLRGLGLEPAEDGAGRLRVAIVPDRKMSVLRDLEGAGHPVIDFEIEEGVGDGSR